MIRATKQAIECLALCAITLASGSSMAATLSVRVVDSAGSPVPNVAVFATYSDNTAVASPPSQSAVMDQVDTQFVPHILLVQKGMSVDFPNSDVVAHHVYSFSKPNNFVLPLYKGEAHEPVTFAHDGIVIIGCNIHDEMIAYIVVVDTELYAMTDSQGVVTFEIKNQASAYEVNIWSPRIRDDEASLVRRVQPEESASIEFSLVKSLRPSRNDAAESIEWSDY